MFFDWSYNLSDFDIIIISLVSLLMSILVTLVYVIIKNKKRVYIKLSNRNNLFYGKGKSGYLEKLKNLTEKTQYIECNFNLNIYNNTNKPYYFRDTSVIKAKRKKDLLEEGTLNINGTSKSVAGVTSYDKLKNITVLPYNCADYDLNIRLSKVEYTKNNYIYIKYLGKKNKMQYIKIKINKKNK